MRPTLRTKRLVQRHSKALAGHLRARVFLLEEEVILASWRRVFLMRFFVQVIEAHDYFYDDPKMCPFSFFFTVQHGVNIVLCILILYGIYSGVVLRDVNSSNIILTRSVC